MQAGRGAIVVVPHMGNWDHIGAYAARHIAPLTTVIERLRWEKVVPGLVRRHSRA